MVQYKNCRHIKTLQILFRKKMCKGIVSSDLFSIITVMFEWAFVLKVHAIYYQLNAISTFVSELAESILFIF